jgi:hypothetical protein
MALRSANTRLRAISVHMASTSQIPVFLGEFYLSAVPAMLEEPANATNLSGTFSLASA